MFKKLALALASAALLWLSCTESKTEVAEAPPAPPPAHLETATLGGGCFWCIEAVFKELQGVYSATSGYSGGATQNPAYAEVCSGTTGHAEVVQVRFDPEVISYRDVLDVFFHVHDPTTLNRQGNDAGTQYRSVVYFHDDAQKQLAEELKAELQEDFDDPIVTEISPAETFYAAEDYHQDYYANNPSKPYCQIVISPKVKKFKTLYSERLKP